MAEKLKTFPLEKNNLHPRNPHRARYDFDKLTQCCPKLADFLFVNKYNIKSIDFSDSNAVKTLNQALLKQFYGILNWDIPPNYLCPPIPGRADYIHYLADLLSSSNNGVLPQKKLIRVLDLGIGANCIYPMIGHKEYGWHFVGSDIDPVAIKSARKIIHVNGLNDVIECRLQQSSSDSFRNVIQPDEVFDLSMCNPPFHASLTDALVGTERKWNNLGYKKSIKTNLNFGGKSNELWCKGGENKFVQNMIEQSAQFPTQCFWYSTLISKKSNLPAVYSALSKANALDVRTINMAQGQKISRIVAWSFLNDAEQKKWRIRNWAL